MLKQYEVKNDILDCTFYDLEGYGKEGKIEGIGYDEILDIILELSAELSTADIGYLIEELGNEVKKRDV